jgi:hypothetical protein
MAGRHGDVSPFIPFHVLLIGSAMTRGRDVFHPYRADIRNVPKSYPTCNVPFSRPTYFFMAPFSRMFHLLV